jgi:integrase
VAQKIVTDGAAEPMARTANLINRKGRWYFNRAYPKTLWPVTGSAPFRISLGTDSLESAQRQRGVAEQRYWAAVDAARRKVGETQPRLLSDIEAVGIVSRWFVERNNLLDDSHLHEPTPVNGHTAAVEDGEYGVAANTRRLGMSDVQGFAKLADRILAAEGIKADPSSKGYASMLQLLARANKELGLIDLARLKGDFGYRPADPVFRAALTDTPATVRTVSDLITAYRADREPGWSQSTRISYDPVWRLLQDSLGERRDVATLTREDGRMLFEMVKGLPRGLGKVAALRGLTVPQAVKRAKELNLPTLAPKSINDIYLGFLKAIFRWAVAEQWMTTNPVDGLTVKDEVAAADKRDPFTPEQLASIFSGAPWMPRDERPRGKPLHFWGPLLGLFHGMRRGEIAQLEVADVTTVHGHHVILVRAGDGKRLKTQNARRMLPVHPELVRMGFLAFVQQQRRDGGTQLFPGEQANMRGQWGDALSDWFQRLVKARKIEGTKLGMHSLRHNWQDQLREAGLHGTAIGQELAGRSKGGDVSSNYGSGFATASLAEAVAKITYPGVDLSHLYVAPPEA